jgi:hypothetical protein
VADLYKRMDMMRLTGMELRQVFNTWTSFERYWSPGRGEKVCLGGTVVQTNPIRCKPFNPMNVNKFNRERHVLRARLHVYVWWGSGTKGHYK